MSGTQVGKHIDISLPGSIVQGQGWALLHSRTIIDVVFSKYGSNDQVKFLVGKIDSDMDDLVANYEACVVVHYIPNAHSGSFGESE